MQRSPTPPAAFSGNNKGKGGDRKKKGKKKRRKGRKGGEEKRGEKGRCYKSVFLCMYILFVSVRIYLYICMCECVYLCVYFLPHCM